MFKNPLLWARASMIFLFLTCIFHSLSLVTSPDPSNETEKLLQELMRTYRIDAGAGFYPSMQNLFVALSSCFSLLCLWGAMNCFFLVKLRPEKQFVKYQLNMMILIFGFCFVIMAFLTFLPPVICTGLIFLSLFLWRWSIEKA